MSVTGVRPARDHAPAGGRPVRRARLRSSAARQVVGWVVLLFFLLFFLTPIVWLLLATTKSQSQITNGAPFSFGSLRAIGNAWHNVYAFDEGAIKTWVQNSLLYSVGAVVLGVAVTVPAGYGLSACSFVGRRLILSVTLVSMIMPGAALILPIFLELSKVQLVGTVWSVVLPLAFFPFGVYLSFIYFSTAIPVDVYEAARLDGCSELGVFLRLGLPLSAPVVALVAFFSFVASWNNFFLPFVMLSDNSQLPLPVGLANLAASSPDFNPTGVLGAAPINRPEIALATVITLLPVMIALLFAQRSVIRSSALLSGSDR